MTDCECTGRVFSLCSFAQYCLLFLLFVSAWGIARNGKILNPNQSVCFLLPLLALPIFLGNLHNRIDSRNARKCTNNQSITTKKPFSCVSNVERTRFMLLRRSMSSRPFSPILFYFNRNIIRAIQFWFSALHVWCVWSNNIKWVRSSGLYNGMGVLFDIDLCVHWLCSVFSTNFDGLVHFISGAFI